MFSRDGENLACSGFVAVIFFLVIDINIGMYRFFKKRKGLYYWSMMLGTLGCCLNAIGIILKFLNTSLSNIWPLSCLLLVVGWTLYTPAELLVLYSRLHLVEKSYKTRRYVLIMIVVTTFVFVIPNWVTTWPAFDIDPKISSVWSPRLAIVNRTTQLAFTLVECVVSGIYIRSLTRMLKIKPSVRERRVMLDLIYVNVVAITVDVLASLLVYFNQVGLADPIQTFSYALKLKLEFTVLNQLIVITAPPQQRDTFEERRYHLPIHPFSGTATASSVSNEKKLPKQSTDSSQNILGGSNFTDLTDIKIPAAVLSSPNNAKNLPPSDQGPGKRSSLVRSLRYPLGQYRREESDEQEMLPIAKKEGEIGVPHAEEGW